MLGPCTLSIDKLSFADVGSGSVDLRKILGMEHSGPGDMGGIVVTSGGFVIAASGQLSVSGARMPRTVRAPEPIDINQDVGQCVIGLAYMATRALIPCGHECLCENCVRAVGNDIVLCPVCRREITTTIG
jgi:hypothetical protein